LPGLRASPFAVTSDATVSYNCIGWAAGDKTRFWWPDRKGKYYWPPHIPRVDTIDAFVAAFVGLGYTVCTSEALERELEKVAIYAKGPVVKHAARQLLSGMWTSKLGPFVDIAHELHAVSGDEYGAVSAILSRPKPARHEQNTPMP
jgi:hypothetical protein